MIRKRLFAPVALLSVLAGCTDNKTNDFVADRDCLYQVSTLQALTASDYYGSTTLKDLLTHGNIGIGTFQGVEGEMIILDGVCYQALADGTVARPAETITIPFASVTWFDADITREITSSCTFEELKAELDKMVATQGANAFYAMSLTGSFSEVKVRSVVKQQEPYIPLDQALKTSQRVFEYSNVQGNLIALYCPPYASGVNAAGWHMHFITTEKDRGGHVLDFNMTGGTLALDRTDNFYMDLPDNAYFNSLNLTGLDEAVDAVEK